MAGFLYTDGKFQGMDLKGDVAALGTLKFTFTSTGLDATTYQDSDLSITNTNPILLSASGKANVFLRNGTYDVVLKDSLGVVIWSKTDFIYDLESVAGDLAELEDDVAELEDDVIKDIDTIAALRLETETPSTVWVSGYHIVNDGAFGSNIFKWDSASTDADNGVDIFKLTAITTGRYKLKYIKASVTFGGVVMDGTNSDTAMQRCIDSGIKTFEVPEGELNLILSNLTNLDSVRFEGSSRVTFTNDRLALFGGILTDKETCLIAGAIRYYDTGASGAGWYLIANQSEGHDPILVKEVSASGVASLIIDLSLDELGLDPSLWTPSGFVTGPDETLADYGCSFGASVGTSSITIKGSITQRDREYISSNGTIFSGSTGRYEFEWINEGLLNARLLVKRSQAALASFNRVSDNNISKFATVTSRQTNGSGTIIPMPSLASVSTDSFGEPQYEVSFWDLTDGSRVTANSIDLKMWLDDPSTKPAGFDFTQVDDSIKNSSNIWFIGAFVRKPSSL